MTFPVRLVVVTANVVGKMQERARATPNSIEERWLIEGWLLAQRAKATQSV
jgi:hypothetical protein